VSEVTSSHFAKYFCDTYSEYITQCTIMTYATFDALRVTPPRLRTLCSQATFCSGWVDNTMNGSQEEIGKLFILFRTLDKFSYHILPIIPAYNAGISWLRSYSWLWSHAWLRSEDMTLVIYPDFGRTSRLRSMSQLQMSLLTPVAHHDSGQWVCPQSYHLSCERLHMAGLDNCSILQLKHLVKNRLGETHDSISVQKLRSHSFACKSS
jgi:hypothetical protein